MTWTTRPTFLVAAPAAFFFSVAIAVAILGSLVTWLSFDCIPMSP